MVYKNNQVHIEDIPLCDIGDYEVLCENLFGSICTGTDLRIIYGNHPNIQYPTILGHESIGRVVKLGKKVRNYQLGDIVTSPYILESSNNKLNSNWGGFCEYGIATDYKSLMKNGIRSGLERFMCNQVVPKDISNEDAVLSISWSETLAYLKKINVKKEDRVLIIGSGTVGLAFAQHVLNMGAKCCIIGSMENKQYFYNIGVSEYVDYKSEALMYNISLKDKNQFDICIDAVGAPKMVEQLIGLIKDRGKLAVYGLNHGNSDNINLSNHKGNIIKYDSSYLLNDVHNDVFRLIRENKLSGDKWFGRNKVYELDEIDMAINDLKKKKILKALIKIMRCV